VINPHLYYSEMEKNICAVKELGHKQIDLQACDMLAAKETML